MLFNFSLSTVRGAWVLGRTGLALRRSVQYTLWGRSGALGGSAPARMGWTVTTDTSACGDHPGHAAIWCILSQHCGSSREHHAAGEACTLPRRVLWSFQWCAGYPIWCILSQQCGSSREHHAAGEACTLPRRVLWSFQWCVGYPIWCILSQQSSREHHAAGEACKLPRRVLWSFQWCAGYPIQFMSSFEDYE